ncbi:MAG: hypothetical protein B9S33_11330 [Pedosphaera sp. Tous-C6FEB]|nr:MAG: hypothetical protein B9S33_11330 [Pedosphaera sp. Tous-C6FEB]
MRSKNFVSLRPAFVTNTLLSAPFQLLAAAWVLCASAGAQDFRINTLTSNNAVVVDVGPVVGDDRGGLAVSATHAFISGDAATGRFHRDTLGSGVSLGLVRDGLVANLASSTVYLLGNGAAPLPHGGGTFNSLIELNGATGVPNGNRITLSTSIPLTGSSSSVGIFSGWDRIVVHNGTRAYRVSLPSGAVTDLGAMATPTRATTENWAYWGIAENVGTDTYLVYVRNSTTVARALVPSGVTTTVATFANLGDMASITVSPAQNRWYFHSEGGSQFGNIGESLGYADATFLAASTAPTLLTQPAPISVLAGEPASFNYTAVGTAPLAYQWYKNTGTGPVAISGATDPIYTIAATTVADAADYSVIIANSAGSVTSSPAALTVTAVSGDIFKIVSLTANNPVVVNASPVVGDDRGGIAVSDTHAFLSGDTATGRFPRDTLTGGASLGVIHDSLVANLATSTVYLLGNGATPLGNGGGTLTTLLELNGATGITNGNRITLSAAIPLTGNSSSVGIFSGWDRIVLHNGTRAYRISLPSGAVTDLGAMATPTRNAAESWAYWGVAENIGADTYIVYISSSTTVSRTLVPNGPTTTVATFESLPDMASFTVSVTQNRWYFHNEIISQFGNYDESLGYADATFLYQFSPPVITAPPQSLAVTPGSNATFTVTATGTPAPTYQWLKNGLTLPGATLATLTLPAVTLADVGDYVVIVSNSRGAVTSAPPATLALAVNDPPTFTLATTHTANEDAGPQIIANHVTNILPGPADEAAQLVTFTVTNNNNALFSTQPAISSTGTLTYTPATNANGTATVTVIARDNGGMANGGVDTSAAQTFTLTINAVNDAPAIAFATNNVVAPVNGGARTQAGFITSFTPGPADEAAQTVLGYTVTHDNAALFTVAPALAANGTLTFTLAAEALGTATVTVRAQDSGGTANGGVDLSAPQTFTVTVVGVNDAPSFGLAMGSPATNTSVVAWGSNGQFQTNVPGGLDGVLAVAASGYHSLALRSDGTVVAWGYNHEGQATVPAGLGGVVAIAAGGYHSLALKSDGTVVAWGRNGSGQTTIPAGLSGVSAIAAGDDHSLALKSDGTVVAWGANWIGQGATPVGLAGVTAIAAGGHHNLALKTDGTVAAWGYTYWGQASVPVGLSGVAAVAAGHEFSLALKSDGTVVAWGRNDEGQTSVPAGLSGVAALDGGWNHAIALQSNGTVVAWGLNNYGQTTIPAGLSGVTAIAAGWEHNLALTGSFTGASGITVAEDSGAYSQANVATNVLAGPADEAGQAVSFLVTNDNAALFSVVPAISTNGTLTFTPAMNAFGTATVTVRAQDNGGTALGGVDTSAAQTFTLTVNPVNDVPSFALAQSSLTLAEDSGSQTIANLATNILAGPSNESTQTVAFLVTSDNAGLFSAGPAVAANGTLTFTPAANANGTATVTLRAQDSGGTANGGVDTSAAQTFTVTVTGVNDAPSFALAASSLTVAQDASAQTLAAFATNILAGSANEAAQLVTFTVTNSNNALFSTQPALAANGTLTYTPTAGVTGTATVTVIAQDNGGTANGGVDTSAAQTFTIVISPANQPPTVTFATNTLVRLEDADAQSIASFATFSPGPAHESTQTVSIVSVTAATTSLFSTQPALAANGTLTFTPATNANGSTLVTVVIQDNGGTANGGVDRSTNTFTVSVTSVNDAPGFALVAGTTALAGETWTARDNNRRRTAIASSTDGSKLVATDYPSGQLYTSTDSGVSWTARESNRAWLGVASSADGSKLVAVDNSPGRIYTSTDGGTNWTARESSRNWYRVASSADGSKLVATVYGGQIYTSTDSGENWTARESSRTWLAVASSADGTKLVAGAIGGQLYTSTDSGVNWTARDSSRDWYAVASSADGSKLVAVVNGSGQIYTSTDSGTNWVARENSRSWTGVASSDDGSKLIATAYPGQIYTSTDSGVTWTARESSRNWWAVASSADGTKLFAGVDGGQIYTSVEVTSPYSLTVAEDTGVYTQSNLVTSILAGPADESGQLVTFTVTNNNNALFSAQPTIGTNGTLTFTPAGNAAGTATVTVIAQDNGGTANGGVDTSAAQTFTITVNAVNDVPTLAAVSDVAVASSASPGLVTVGLSGISAGPGESGLLSVVASASDPSRVPNPSVSYTSPSTTGTLTFTPVANATGTVVITVTVHEDNDANGTYDASFSRTFSVTFGTAPAFPAEIRLTGTSVANIARPPAQPWVAVPGYAGEFTVEPATGLGPITYQWFRDGQALAGATGTNYSIAAFGHWVQGDYTVVATSPYGSSTSSVAALYVPNIVGTYNAPPYFEGTDANENFYVTLPRSATNLTAIAFAKQSDNIFVGLKPDGTVLAFGRTGPNVSGGADAAVATNAPAGLTNATAVAAGWQHALALRVDGSVVAWGDNSFGQTNVPANATNVVAIAAGGNTCLALRADGTVVEWGGLAENFRVPIPADLANVVGISVGNSLSGGYTHCVAVLADGTVRAWGDITGAGSDNVPPAGLSNVVLVAAGNRLTLAIRRDGTVIGWGEYSAGAAIATYLGDVTNAVAAAALGSTSAMVLLADGTVRVTGGVQSLRPPGPGYHVAALAGGNRDFISLVASSGAPVLTTVPRAQSTFLGGTVQLTALALAPGGASYQWFFNGNAVTGATSGTLTMNAIQANQAGNYTVVVTNASGSVTSSVATVTVINPPLLSAQPASLTVAVGGSATFSVTATGGSPLAYQWSRNGAAVADATNSSLAFTNVQVASAGDYQVVVTNAYGAVTSSVARLTVGSSLNDDLVAWYPLDGDLLDYSGNARHGAATNFTPSYLTGPVGQALKFAGNSQNRVDLQTWVPGTNSFTFSGWVKYDSTNEFARWAYDPTMPLFHSGSGDLSHGFAVALNMRPAGIVPTFMSVSGMGTSVVADGTNAAGAGVWHHLVGVMDRAAGEMRLYLNGALASSMSVASLGPINSTWSHLGGYHNGTSHNMAHAARQDDVRIYSRALGEAEILSLASALHITAQPTNQTVFAGQSATLDVAALGTAPLAYQWRKAGVNLLSGTNAQLTLAPVTSDDAGNYDVVVTDSTGSVTSGVATVTVNLPNAAPSFALSAASVTALEDAGAQTHSAFVTNIVAGPANEAAQTVTLSVTAANTALFSSQPVIAANGTLTFTPAANANGSTLVTVVAQDTGGTAGGGVDRATNTFTISVTAVNDAPGLALDSFGAGKVLSWGSLSTVANPAAAESGVVAVSGGASFNVILKADGTVHAWGNNPNGEASVPSAAQGAVAITTGRNHALALVNGGVIGWGYNDFGQITVPTAAQSGVVAIGAGANHSLAVKADGSVVAWGRNNYGQSSPPASAINVVAVSAGEHHSLALRADGSVIAWGRDSSGQSTVPGMIGTNAVAVAAGEQFSLALLANGTVVGWGDNGAGQVSIPASATSGVIAIAAGVYHSVALKADGTVLTWGQDSSGQVTIPGAASGGNIAVAAGDYHTVVLNTTGALPGVFVREDAATPSFSGAVKMVVAGPSDESGQVVSFVVTNDNAALFTVAPAIGTNGTLTFTPAGNANGSATVTVLAQDNGGTANGGVDMSAAQTFTITVTAVNDAPSFALAGTNLTVFAGDGAVAQSAWATNISAGLANEAAQSVSFVVTNSDNTKFTVQPALAANGSLTFTPAANATGVVTVGVRAVDSGGTVNGGVDTSAVQTFTLSLAASKVVLPAAFAAGVGDAISVPVNLLGSGIENGVAFTVTYPAAQLTYTGASAGGSSAGATVLANTSTAGQAGVLVFRALGTTWSAGSNEVVFLHFTVAAGSGGASVPLAFADGVVARQVSDVDAVEITPVLYVAGAVQVAAPGVLEGDVSPRPTGSGTVTVTDAIQISRFAAGLDSVTNFGVGGEFQRADVAPRASLGDGRLTVADAIQAQRYAAGLDPATTAGGPTGFGGAVAAAAAAKLSTGARVVRVVGGNLVAGRANSVAVQVDAQGDEAGLSLSLAFDPAALTFVSATAGPGAGGGALVVNAARATSGRVGLVLMLPAGSSLAAGTRDVVTLTFNVTGRGATSIQVAGDLPVVREVADTNANVLGASFVGASFNIVLPTGLQAAGVERAADGSLRLVIRNADGSPVTAGQAAQYAVHVTSNLGGVWTLLPNALVLENGALKIVDPAASGAGLRLYKLVEAR